MGAARSLSGIRYQLLDDATSSGTLSNRIMLGAAYANFGASAVFSTTSHAGDISVALYGSAAASTDVTTGQTILTWSTDSGLLAVSTGAQPVSQIWAELTASSSLASVDFWVAMTP